VTLEVATFNVWGRWAGWPERADVLRRTWPSPGPDVVLLQEVRHDADGDQAAEIAELLGYPVQVTVEGHRADDGGEGLAVLSRVPLHDIHHEPLPTSDPPRRVLVARVRIGDTLVTLLGGHTVAVPEEVRVEQVRALLCREDSPAILAADLNDTPDAIAPLLDGAGLVDVLGDDEVATWPMCELTFGDAWRDRIGRVPHFSLHRRRLDYLLCRGVGVVDAGVHELRDGEGRYASDHALVWARFRAPG
jgi:endonuclease/exonuclease/phosphatase family metal-dependent hydrolase